MTLHSFFFSLLSTIKFNYQTTTLINKIFNKKNPVNSMKNKERLIVKIDIYCV